MDTPKLTFSFAFQYPPNSHEEIKNTLENVSKGATDMVLKLLEKNPQCRLRSLNQIKIQPFFHGFHFSDVVSKKVDKISFSNEVTVIFTVMMYLPRN